MICATFNGNPYTTIISCYCFPNDSDEMHVTTSYGKICSLVRHIPKHNVLSNSGDMNTQISKDENNKFCLHKRNGKYLADFSLKNRPNSNSEKERESNRLSTPT